MRGLIHKEICLYLKGIEKRALFIVAAVVIFLMVKAGEYAGLLASIMLAMTIGIQSIMNFASDEKTDWKKYQMALPVNNFHVVASKYISVVSIALFGVCGTLFLNLLSSVVHSSWDFTLWGLSAIVGMIIPLVWSGICLPLTYWFGFKSAQMMGIVCIFPMVYLVNFFEDGPGLSVLPDTILSYILVTMLAAAVIFIVSLFISIVGYSRKK